jgi:hypothetical protein
MAKTTKVILGKLKEDFEVNNCLEWSKYVPTPIGLPFKQEDFKQSCLKNEKFLLKKGTTFQSKRYTVVLDPVTFVRSDDSNVNIAYLNGEFNVPLSKVEILGYKYVKNDELMNFKNNFDTTNNQNTQSQNQKVSFLESHPKLIMTVFIGIGLYIGYKKFMK